MKIKVLGIPMDLGANRRGVDMGCSAIRYANLQNRLEKIGYHVEDYGDIYVPNAEKINIKRPILKYAEEIIEVCERTAPLISKFMEEGFIPLILGGDHSISIGTIAGCSNALGDVGIIWFDAHGDFNTEETSPSGNIHGMSLGASIGYGDEMLVKVGGKKGKARPENVALIGVRDIDPKEAELIKESGINVFTIEQIDFMGMREVMELAINIASNGTKGIHVSFDMDVIDPSVAPGVGTPVQGGISYREAHLAMEMVANSKMLKCLEFVEVNPILDNKNQTAELVVSLACSALGKKII
ncbi:MAG: arginase [Firmicutes bacterium]|nr:arginase [Bacillota bacterium]